MKSSLLLCLAAFVAAALAAPALRSAEGGYSTSIVGARSPFGVRAEIRGNENNRIHINEVSLEGVTGALSNITAANCALTINNLPVPANVVLENDVIRFIPTAEVYVDGNKPIDAGCMGVGITGHTGRRRSFLVIRHDNDKRMTASVKYDVRNRATIGGTARDRNGFNYDPATATLVGSARNFNIDAEGARLRWTFDKADLTNAQCTLNVANTTSYQAVVDPKAHTVTVEGVTVMADQAAELTCTNVHFKNENERKRARGVLHWVDREGKKVYAEMHGKICEGGFCSPAAAAGVSGFVAIIAIAAAAVVGLAL